MQEALHGHSHTCDLDGTMSATKSKPSTPTSAKKSKPSTPLSAAPPTPPPPPPPPPQPPGTPTGSKSKTSTTSTSDPNKKTIPPGSPKTSKVAKGKGGKKGKVRPKRTVVGEVPQPEPESGCQRCRRILAQIIASTTKNLLLLDLGLAAAMPTIIIPVLRGLQEPKGPPEPISFEAYQASWYGGVAYIGQPIGSLISGLIVDPLGRKPSMILANVPYIISWILLYFSERTWHVFTADALVGFGAGLLEAPVITYIGEICEPSLRGILVSSAGVFTMIGFLIVYFLGSIFAWRTVAIICMAVPILASVAIPFVPETPMWLLTKQRPEAAMLSLRWLRGWTAPEVVQTEFSAQQRYAERATSCTTCEIKEVPCPHLIRSIAQRVRDLFHISTCRPFIILFVCFFISQFTGYMSMRPFMIQIFKMCGVPLDLNWATVCVGGVGLGSNLICMVLVRIIGKRPLYLISLTGAALSTLTLAIWSLFNIDSTWSSFDAHDSVVSGEEGLVPLGAFLCLVFFNAFGLMPIPWIMLSEVYPNKSRGLASGITASINYVMIFVSISTFIYFERWFTFAGVLFMYSAIGFVGLLFVLIMVPETEGKTLEEIELYFSDEKRRCYDRTIQKYPAPPPLRT